MRERGRTTNSIRTLDLFCGAGGSSCGARLAGARPVCGIDLWDVATDTYEANNPGSRVYAADVRKLSPATVHKEIGDIDLILASPECTNHSPAKGAAPRCEESRRTAFQVVRFAQEFNPRWIVVENVISMQRWKRFEEWKQAVEDLGYKSQTAKLCAADFGVAQTRRRLFIVFDRDRQPKMPSLPQQAVPTIGDVIKDMNGIAQSWQMRPLFGNGRARGTITRAQRAIRELGKGHPFLVVYYGTDGSGGWQPLTRPLRTITTLDRFALVMHKDGKYVMRMLQPPELALAMGFPADYVWPDTSRRNRIKLIGNAVCPPVMCAVITTATLSTQIELGSKGYEH